MTRSRTARGGSREAVVVQQLLSTHRVYSPLDWLLETNNLGYDDYRAWRRGEKSTLDEFLAKGPQATRAMLERANNSAQTLDVTEETVALYGTDENAGTELKASADNQLDQLLRTEFRLTEDHRQLDVFFDTPDTSAFSDLYHALASRDELAASKCLEALARVDVHHWAIADAATLIEALSSPPPSNQAQGRERLDTMERRWLPAAQAVLHARARDFLTPLWRDVAAALEGAPFDPAHPRRHPSWPYAQGLDWRNVRRVLRAARDCATNPVLLGRLAEAEWRLRERNAAVECWFALCRLAPEHFETVIDNPRFPDSSLKRGWERAQDAEVEPAISPPWFPAWMVVEERGLAKAMKPRRGESEPERAFNVALALVQGGTDRQNIENRRALQTLHPGLLQRYLDSLDR